MHMKLAGIKIFQLITHKYDIGKVQNNRQLK